MRPNYKRAIQELSVILKAAKKRRGSSSRSSETDKGIQDITQESSEIAYQFTDHDLLVIKDTSKGDKDEK
tara:strand:- start:217 stop:426 length:210 start_codon:yes stop_codon:yes gene_type:complete